MVYIFIWKCIKIILFVSGRQLFGMKGHIQISNGTKIQYDNIICEGNGRPIFGCDEKKNDDHIGNADDDQKDAEELQLVKALLRKGLHIDTIANAVKTKKDLIKVDDIHNAICNGGKLKASKKDQEMYNKQDIVYNEIFGGFDNEIIGVNIGRSGVFLDDTVLKWIYSTCSTV